MTHRHLAQMVVSRAFINTDRRGFRPTCVEQTWLKALASFLSWVRIKRRLIENSRLFMSVWHWLSLAWLSFFLGEKEQVCFSLYAFSMQQCQHGFPSDTVTISVSLKINGTHEIWHCFLKVLCCCCYCYHLCWNGWTLDTPLPGRRRTARSPTWSSRSAAPAT